MIEQIFNYFAANRCPKQGAKQRTVLDCQLLSIKGPEALPLERLLKFRRTIFQPDEGGRVP